MRLFKTLLLCAALFMLATGCKTTLEEGGAYHPVGYEQDVTFWNVESGFKASYASLDFVFMFERANRDLLWKISPKIKGALDKIRPEAVKIRDQYIFARDVYDANKTPDNLTKMQGLLNDLNRLLATAQSVIQDYR